MDILEIVASASPDIINAICTYQIYLVWSLLTKQTGNHAGSSHTSLSIHLDDLAIRLVSFFPGEEECQHDRLELLSCAIHVSLVSLHPHGDRLKYGRNKWRSRHCLHCHCHVATLANISRFDTNWLTSQTRLEMIASHTMTNFKHWMSLSLAWVSLLQWSVVFSCLVNNLTWQFLFSRKLSYCNLLSDSKHGQG